MNGYGYEMNEGIFSLFVISISTWCFVRASSRIKKPDLFFSLGRICSNVVVVVWSVILAWDFKITPEMAVFFIGNRNLDDSFTNLYLLVLKRELNWSVD